MDAYTMVIVACIAGEAGCRQERISQMDFVTEEACESQINSVVSRMTKTFALEPDLKGKTVEYDVSCMNRQQLRVKLGISQFDM